MAGTALDGRNIIDLLAMPDAGDIEFEIPRLPDDFLKPAEL